MRFHLFIAVIFTTLLGITAQAQEPLLYVPFDKMTDAVIAKGEARNLGSSSFSYSPGIRGEAVSLNDNCLFAMPGNFNLSEGTIAVWVRPQWEATDAGNHVLFCFYGDVALPYNWAANRFSIVLSGGKCSFTIFAQDGVRQIEISAPMANWLAGDWHHVAVSWANINSGAPDARMYMYFDGQQVAERSNEQIDIGKTDTVMAIGRDQDGSPDYIAADLDDFFIYPRQLTPEEIANGVATILQNPDYLLPEEAQFTHDVAGWWDANLQYRAQVILPAIDKPRKDVYVQCPLHLSADVGMLGRAGAVTADAVQVVGKDGQVVPFNVSDDLAEWMVAGDIPAGEIRKFYLYFKPTKYEITAPLVSVQKTGSVKTQQALIDIPDYATQVLGKPWNFDDGSFNGIDQWGDKPEYLRNKQVVDGVMTMDVTNDPFFVWGDMWGQVDELNSKIAIDLQKYPVLEMRVRQSVPAAKWQLYGRIGNGSSLLTHEFMVSGTSWQRIHINLLKDARWGGVLSAFRIDPTQDADAHIEIDWIRLVAAQTVQREAVEALGEPQNIAAKMSIDMPPGDVIAGSSQEIAIHVDDASGKPVAGQAVRVELISGSGGLLESSTSQTSLSLGKQGRRGITDAEGILRVKYTANPRADLAADTIQASTEFASKQDVDVAMKINTEPGLPHHYRVEPVKVATMKAGDDPLAVSAQLVDEFDNPLVMEREITWETDVSGNITQEQSRTDAQGFATALWQGDEEKRWVYTVRVKDAEGLTGTSADICLLPSKPRQDPIVLGENGYFRKGKDGPAWLPLGGFYANWVGLPASGEEGRGVISFVDATEEQMVHWLDYLASQGVTAMRFMLRAHRPNGMEPMDVLGRVNMPLFAKALRYLDLARKHDIRFMLVIHEDYTKPSYYDSSALNSFCLQHYEGEDLDALPPFQRRFVRDKRLLTQISEKYTDPDVMACQDQYAKQLIGLLKDNPQLYAWEFENEMVDCPASWANHAAKVIRSVDPVTPICASHGGGGLNTADPAWWTQKTDIDFYTYHLYPHTSSTSPELDYGAAADLLTCYGRMAGICMFGETSGDEFFYYPADRDNDRRYIMRDLIWFSLVNGNPGCFFWNARGIEVEQFKLAKEITSTFDWSDWQREQPEVAINVAHSLNDDKYYRKPEGIAENWRMGDYVQHYLSAGIDFDFTMNPGKYAKVAELDEFNPPTGISRISAGAGWQIRANCRKGLTEGLAYVRNFSGIRHWEVPGKANMYLRARIEAPLNLQLNIPIEQINVHVVDLDTGQAQDFSVAGDANISLGVTDHDFAVIWRLP